MDKIPAVIHVDLDGASAIYRHHRWDFRHVRDQLFETGAEHLLQFLEYNRIRATLFTIADDLGDPRKREWIRQAAAAGHEIASHSVSHPDFDRLSIDAKRVEISESKKRLEDELGAPVIGFRAPSYKMDRETLEIVGQCGYDYDSSVFPSGRFAQRLDLPYVFPFPHQPLLGQSLLELPLPATRPWSLPFHASYSLILGVGHFRRGLSRFQRQGHPLVLLFHLADFADPLPREQLATWKSRWYTLSHRSAGNKVKACQKMVDMLRKHYVVTTTNELVSTVRQQGDCRLVLGISTTHETGSAVFRGAECLAAVSEERLDRIKFSTKFPPKRSIVEVLRAAKVSPQTVTDVVVAGLPPEKLLGVMARGQLRDTCEFHGLGDYVPHGNRLLYRAFGFARSLGYRRVRRFLKRQYGITPRLHFIEHHRCHASSAYRTAPFDDAIVFTADGVGDGLSATVSRAQNGRIKTLHEIWYPHSFGQFYTACTQLLGFRANRHEGKITGLSGFGQLDPELYDKVRQTIRRSGPDFRLDKRYYAEGIIRGFNWKMLCKGGDLFKALQYRNYKRALKRLLSGYSRENVACVFQTVLEEELQRVLSPFVETRAPPNLCLAGGIFANVKANAALFHRLGFQHVYVFPHMGDGGLAAGAALELLQASPTPFQSVYWGPEYTEQQIELALRRAERSGVRYRRPGNIEQAVAQLLAKGKVIARFDGRMEFGPRALCNRSILYSAADPSANDWLNRSLGRTEFMPFAPVALEEDADRHFVGLDGAEHACKFMTIVVDCTDFTKQKCPAIVHVDGTAQPQLVNSAINPSMTRVLEYYRELTGVGLLVNTSFNMHEEPIVCTPGDAVRAFLASRIDYLAAGPFLAWQAEKADNDTHSMGQSQLATVGQTIDD